MTGARSAAWLWGGGSVALVLATLTVVCVHVRTLGREAIAASDRALAAGDTADAMAWAREAAMAVAPGSPYPEQGFVRLTSLAERAEARGDFAGAIAAWRAVGVALRATTRDADDPARRDAADRAVIRLSGRACEEDQSRPPAVCAAAARDALAVLPLPRPSRFRWLGVGALAFLGAVAWGSTAGTPRERWVAGGLALAGACVAAAALVLR